MAEQAKSGADAAAAKDAPTPNEGLSRLFLIGSSFAGTGMLGYAVISLVREQPERAFQLFQKWGPWCFLSLFGTWALYQLLSPLVHASVDAFGRLSTSVENLAASQASQAISMQKSADKEDWQVQEMQTLTALTAQRSEKTYSMMQAFHEDNQAVSKAQATILQTLAESLRRIETKVDQKQSSPEKSAT